ncbi:hypothetical protein acsn021_29030 [Anaerocolumna cellulosilytica]|uniref:Uncharacterized protein n=1 Tax=Anaerocolumna cellulosilytica TaxID=433286 RepID=A0A6S6QXF9_9FIRM|nr:type I-B CRISPR-associated protein Cas8b1/Cst1 [Anaerocolumna cellulosilytica]MBB5197121.1 CRISPR-associated protein Cst1 [Anaerocolumna cellulosilytica]BCJ95334.1 hypothetical protein acsn021_29030 [Anaerocolumna cellulosilytica]
MEREEITLQLGDWMWNAALTGFINIIGKNNINFHNNTINFHVRHLENFEEKYFEYFINTYENTLPWYRIVSYKDKIEYHRDNDFKAVDLKELKNINIFIKDTLKRYLTSNSFKAAFKLMGDMDYIQTLEKKLQKVKEPKDDKSFEQEKSKFIEEVKIQYKIIEDIICYCSHESGKRYIAGKNVIYGILKNGWNGVSFLYPQTKTLDIYEDYNTYFIKPVFEYLQFDQSKYKNECFTCGMPMKDFNNDMSFLNQFGFDIARKTSHVWNFYNDIAVCPICKLIYSCLPAGFTYVTGRGLYINANVNMEYNIKVNNQVKADILKGGENNYDTRKLYSVLVNALIKQTLEKEIFELADVQIVRYENESYKFNIVPESTLCVIKDCIIEIAGKEEKQGLLRAYYKEGKETISIYEQVLNHLFNNQNLFLLIHKLLYYKISTPNNCFFHTGHINNILNINIELIKRLGGLKDMNSNYRLRALQEGKKLREAYKDSNKLSGINYRLMNALKTGNKYMFMDLVLNCYMYVGKEVPSIIPEILQEESEVFYTIGYAFVTNLIDGDKDRNSNNNESNKENK